MPNFSGYSTTPGPQSSRRRRHFSTHWNSYNDPAAVANTINKYHRREPSFRRRRTCDRHVPETFLAARFESGSRASGGPGDSSASSTRRGLLCRTSPSCWARGKCHTLYGITAPTMSSLRTRPWLDSTTWRPRQCLATPTRQRWRWPSRSRCWVRITPSRWSNDTLDVFAARPTLSPTRGYIITPASHVTS